MHDLISVPDDYSIEHNIAYLARSSKEPLHYVAGTSVFKLLSVTGKKILVHLNFQGKTLEVNYLNTRPGLRARKHVLNYIEDWLDLRTDLTPFYKLVEKDKLLKDIVARYRGYRIVGQPDLFESLCWAVIGQQINLAFAYTIKQRFVEQFGERLEWKGKTYFLFPTPERVAALTDMDLLPLQFSRQKSLYVRNIAGAFLEGRISRADLAILPFEEAKQALMSIKGIGNWTANYALLKSYRHPNAFPAEDAGVHNAIKKLKHLESKPTLEEVKKIFKRYVGWEAYATIYMWKAL
jgi:DNA-3-methyladenine glycosylase II